MPMPWTYRQATREWQAFLADAREAMSLESDNATYTAVQGVLQAFRRRLTAQAAIDFAQVLPSVLRALFVADWQRANPLPPGTRADWTAEAMALRHTTTSPRPTASRPPPSPYGNPSSARIWTACWPPCPPLRRSSGRPPASTPPLSAPA